ncbi:MAG: ligase-associated DNA damage response endonuclease PdeM [Henriciella sp.]
MSQPLAKRKEETLLHVRGTLLTPLPEGALWWGEQETLIVSDLHFEKGSSFAARGQMLPPYDTAATLDIVEALVTAHRPKSVISLGDSFHDPSAESRIDEQSQARIRKLTNTVDWVWVEGNHDPDPPAHLGGRAAKVLRIGDLVFRHIPTGEIGEISGHLHPKARISGKHRTLRRRCFATDGQRVVMPAMGAFTGGLNILHEAFIEAFPDGGMMAFVMGRDQVFPVARRRLLPEGANPGAGRWRLQTG